MLIGVLAPVVCLSILAGIASAAWRGLIWLKTGIFPHWPLAAFGVNSSNIKTDWVGVAHAINWVGALDIGFAIPLAGIALVGIAAIFSED